MAVSVAASDLLWSALNQPKHISHLQEAIQFLHGCEAKYSRTVLVRQAFPGEIGWDGFVRVFALIGCPKANHCFAWSYRDGNEIKTIAVLEIAPIDSAEAAVQASIAASCALLGDRS